MKYKAVLFDMDGTVLDTIQDLTDATNAALKQFNMPERTRKEITAIIGNGARRQMERSVPPGTSQDTLEAIISWYKDFYNQHSTVKTAPYAGIPLLMQHLREHGVKTAIVSNKPDRTVQKLGTLYFDGLMDYCIGESPAQRRKPAPDMVLKCAQYLGLPVSDCVYIGDTEVDLLTARNAGIDCVTVTWGYRSVEMLKESGASVLIDTVPDLERYLLD